MNQLSSLFGSLKRIFYFPLAKYFGFWARIVLMRWQPRIIVVTGSSGKTTMLHMLEAQIGTFAKVSHNANSAFGIPLDILNLRGIEGSRLKWLLLFMLAPIRALSLKHGVGYYVAEADADRPNEARFLANLLQPEITVWVSSARSHASQFEKLAQYKQLSVEQVIADEFSWLAKKTSGLVLADGDNKNVIEALKGDLTAKKVLVKTTAVSEFKVDAKQTIIKLDDKRIYSFNQPQPPVIAHQVAYIDEVMKYLEIEPDYEFSRFDYPPGRSSVFKGRSGATIIDSTYNINPSSLAAVLEMFEQYPAKQKILVLGDLTEQGEGEEAAHIEVAKLVAESGIKFKEIVLYGERVKKYTHSVLQQALPKVPVTILTKPLDVANFLESELSGKEVVLFKGAGFMEGIIERLLDDPKDAQYLPRRGELWDKRRKEFGI